MLSRDEVCRLYSLGVTANQLAAQEGVSGQTMCRRMEQMGIKRRPQNERNQIYWRSRGKIAKPSKVTLEQAYVHDQLSTHLIALQYHVTQFTILNWLRSYDITVRTLSEANKLRHLRGSNNPSWKGGRYKNKSGYIFVLAPSHPSADSRGYVKEHALVWEQTHGMPVPTGKIIHHLNGIEDDNRPENLVALTQAEHMKLHRTCLKEMDGLERRVDMLFNKVIELEYIIEIMAAMQKGLPISEIQEGI